MRPPGLGAPSSCGGRDRNCVHFRSQPRGSVAGSFVHSVWVLSGFASSSDWVYTGTNKANCLANNPGCKGLSQPHAEA